MKFCSKCGMQIVDDAVVCVHCGNEVKTSDVQTSADLPRVSKYVIENKVIIIISAIVLILGMLAAILFVPRNLKMNDFKEVNIVSAIIKYGWPDAIRTSDDGEVFLSYGEKVDFYGITPFSFAVYPDEEKFVFFFKDDDSYDVYRKIDRYCELEDVLISFHIFGYKDLEITTNDYDGSYVRIEMN